MKGFRFPGETLILNDDLRATAPGCFVELTCGTTHYELDGPVDGQTVVLIHGFSIPFQIWDTAFNPLAEAGFRVLRYDLFGRGYSDRPRIIYNRELFDQQLLDLLNALEVSLPVDLIGLSMGGAISVGFCHRHPEFVRKLVLIDPSGFPLNIPGWAKLIKAPILGELLLSLYGERYLISSLRSDFYKAEKYPEYVEIARKQMKIAGYLEALLSTIRHDMLGDLSEVYREVGKQWRPSCLIWGVEDQTIPFEINELVRKAIPHIAFHGKKPGYPTACCGDEWQAGVWGRQPYFGLSCEYRTFVKMPRGLLRGSSLLRNGVTSPTMNIPRKFSQY